MFWRLAMDSEARIKRTSGRANREDGDATKARIIEAAGRLIAEHGYAETTSKDICEMAQTNIAAVNYHFGSRDGLYAAVLTTVHNYILNLDFLMELVESDLSPRAKLETFIETITRFDKSCWQLRLWAKEVVAPSELWLKLIHEQSFKADLMLKMLSQYTGIPVGEQELNFCLLSLMSPIMVLLVTGNHKKDTNLPRLQCGPEALAAHLKAFYFAGAEKIIKEYTERKNIPMMFTA